MQQEEEEEVRDFLMMAILMILSGCFLWSNAGTVIYIPTHIFTALWKKYENLLIALALKDLAPNLLIRVAHFVRR
jgi:hypothetical protein